MAAAEVLEGAKYRWKEGKRLNAPARVVGPLIHDFLCRNGRMMEPDELVELAKDTPELSAAFDHWDVEVAAKKHWRAVARTILHSIEWKHPDQERYIPIVFNVPVPDVGRKYVEVSFLTTRPDLTQNLLAESMRTLEGWQRRVERIEELQPIFEEVFEAIKKAKTKIKRRNTMAAKKAAK
jgi:hypothetical protein